MQTNRSQATEGYRRKAHKIAKSNYRIQAAKSRPKQNDRVESGVSTNFRSWLGKGSVELLRKVQNGEA